MNSIVSETQKVITYLKEVETLAQEILSDKESKLELSNTQNKLREAIRALEQSEENKSWLKVGGIFIRMPKERCIATLREEMDNVTGELNELHEGIRNKVSKLRDLEHEPRIQGFGLKPLTGTEAKTIYKAFGVT